ncbi:hypothetical protein ES705_25897 [subsurface metagenome]
MFVLWATPQQLGEEQSERVGGTFFYFGEMAIRGGITYISFVLLLVPLIIKNLDGVKRVILLICTVFVIIVLLGVLKRFVFVVLGLGILNYLRSRKIQKKYKKRIIIGIAIISVLFFQSDKIKSIIENRYQERGAENKFSIEVLEKDLRIYEPLYVIQAVINKPFLNIIFGSKDRAVMDIEHFGTYFEYREIHNQYATFALEYGLLGLFAYLLIFYKLYKTTLKIKTNLSKRNLLKWEYWIVFQNLVLIFFIEGMVGGHVHITFRGLIFLYAGAISGYLYKLAKQKPNIGHLPKS